MNYFVTGATGFIGRFLLERLLARPDAQVYVLVRASSVERLRARLGPLGAAAERVHPVIGDITLPGLVDDASALPSRIDHVFHLAAVYDMSMRPEVGEAINVQGTQNVVEFANRAGQGVMLHHVSSIAVSGPYFEGVFSEQDFDEGQKLGHPYYRTKFVAEKVVRDTARVPFRIYRPGIVVGHSRTGEIDKIDGPYYFFGKVRVFSRWLPSWLRLPIVEGGELPLVPVDYVADSIDAIAHRSDVEGNVFCLVPPRPTTVGELVQLLFRVAGGPHVVRMAWPAAARLANRIMRLIGWLFVGPLAPVLTWLLGFPASVFEQLFTQTHYDDRMAQQALAGTGVRCPELAEYVETLWNGWEHSEFAGGAPAQKHSGHATRAPQRPENEPSPAVRPPPPA